MNPQQHPSYQPAPPLPGTGGQAPAPGQPRTPNPEITRRHEESKKKYPQLHLSRGEYVIEEVRRHPIGIVSIWFFVALLVTIIFTVLGWYGFNPDFVARLLMTEPDQLLSAAELFPLALILSAFVVLGGIIATIVYEGNRFYLTNESVIQFVQHSLFMTRQQVVNLINVEDASTDQKGIIEQVLNFGTLRLSTQGDETVYHFYFVANPRRVVNVVNEAAEQAVRKLEGIPPSEY